MTTASTSPPAGVSRSTCGLRERKKRRTRDALVHAALELFHTKGYDHTTVREITDAVEVSERTFFRYFASKEALLLSFVVTAADTFVIQLGQRPASERPVEALRNAMRSAARQLRPDRPGGGQIDYLRAIRLIEATPALLAAHLMVGQDLTERLIRIIAAREGVDPITDSRPRIVASVFCALMTAASQVWCGDGDVDRMVAIADGYLAELVPTLTEAWS